MGMWYKSSGGGFFTESTANSLVDVNWKSPSSFSCHNHWFRRRNCHTGVTWIYFSQYQVVEAGVIVNGIARRHNGKKNIECDGYEMPQKVDDGVMNIQIQEPTMDEALNWIKMKSPFRPYHLFITAN